MRTVHRAVTSACVVLWVVGVASAQPTGDSVLADRPNGPRSAEPTHHVFIGGVVHPEPGVVWAQGFIEIRDGLIVRAMDASLDDVAVPPGAVVHDLEGEHVYAALVDAYVEVEAPAPGADRPGAHWNSGVMPWRSALDGVGMPEGDAESRRAMGFGTAVIVPAGGLFAGSAAAVSLAERPADRSAERVEVYRDGVYQALDFESRGWGRGAYPTSTPGAVALMRQTLIDADWQGAWEPTLDGSHPRNAISPLEDRGVPLVFDCEHELEHFLAAEIASEFGRRAVIMGNGMEFKWLDGIAGLGLDMIVPLRFPAKPDVSTVGKAEAVELEAMMTWEQAPTNLRRLAEAATESTLALTASMLPKGREFHDELRVAIRNGLSEDAALAMLTIGPAEIAGIADQVGTIEAGKRANLLVASGPLFEEKTARRDLWIDGVRHELSRRPGPSFDGAWRMWVGDEAAPAFEMTLDISGTAGKKPKVVGTERWSPAGPEGQLAEAAEPHSAEARKVAVEGDRLAFVLDDEDDEGGSYIVSGSLVGDDLMLGSAVAIDGSVFEWSARKVDAADEPDAQPAGGEEGDAEGEKENDAIEEAPPLPGYPFGPYAMRFEPPQETVLLTNATVWTGTELGRYETGWLLMRLGRIVRVEPGPAPDWLLDGSNEEIVVLDASGKHVTPGLIDAHSHTGLFQFGVNEAGQAVTAEVRIGDSLDPSHINWYRQLAMGVTCVNSLHGSANPIGGQNAVHKVRWGVKKPIEMRMDGARPGIKFALGENVVQSNSGRSERWRYPQTRMGVEALIRDRFVAAREYAERLGSHAEEAATERRSDAATKGGDHAAGTNASGSDRRDGMRSPGPDSRAGGEGVTTPASLRRSVAPSLPPPRRDLELEALAQILGGERLVHCHSYRQDEILMLCRVAEDFGFQIGTFQHGLEVYKVAEAVRERAIGASLFSDWWMYKIEVMDAIPFAGPLQTEAGVLTSYNSDSDELARRLNTEAAKAVKYARPGTMTEEAALAFVTSNPAVQIGAGSTGRLEEGLDADIVVWSDHPLSTRAVAERVYVDGREYFSTEQDRRLRAWNASERQRLIQKILEAPARGGKAEPDDAGDEPVAEEPPPQDRRGVIASWRRAGFHPDDMRPGDCGCGIINHAIYYEGGER